MKTIRTIRIAALAGFLGTLIPAQAALAQSHAYNQLATDWWQWVLSIPRTANPLLDATGERCMVGQRGDVWFLAGVFLPPNTVERACSVPSGTSLFFPVINSVNFDTPGQCGQTDPLPASFYRAAAAAFVDGAANLSVTLDGEPAGPMHRTRSPVFEVALPADNLFVGFCDPDLSAGIYSPAVDDGIYVRLNPLPVGAHTLHIHAENPGQGFVVDVTYHLTIVPVVAK